jgi:hypothetical protein
MTSFTLSIDGSQPVTSTLTQQDVITIPDTLPPGVFVRVLHEKELAANLPHTTPYKRPEVRPFFPNGFVPFGESWQLLAWSMNPLLSAGNMTAVYDYRLWIANDNGLGDPNDPRANYFTRSNLSSSLPKVEALTCGGNLLHVLGEARVKTNSGLEDCYQIDYLDWRLPVSPPFIQARPWLSTWAVTLGGDGTPRRFSYGTQADGFVPGVRHPLVASGPIYIPKWRVVKWDGSLPPDPYRVYVEG